MFSALAASTSTILAALLQKLKTPPKHLRLIICLLVVVLIVSVIFAFTTGNRHDDKDNKEQSVTIGIINIDININFSALKKEEIKEIFDEINKLYRVTSLEEAWEIYSIIEEKLNEHE
jgi:Tfp pilus assembly protein PilO